MKVTIIGVKQARLGYTFLFAGSTDSCAQCKYYLPCLGSLESGRVYTVTKVIGKELHCILHDKGKVVEVQESSREVLIDQKSAILGAIITLNLVRCDLLECRNRDRCFPLGLVTGDKCRILSIGDEATCSLGLWLVEASLERQPPVS
jgi:uncharacterized protein (UPF0179 family)